MSTLEKRIGGKITEIRLLKKKTQANLAETVNVSVETISRMERGIAFPSLKTMNKIANALDVPLKDFFNFDDNQAKDSEYERELSKVIAYLRTLDKQKLKTAYKVLKGVFNNLGKLP